MQEQKKVVSITVQRVCDSRVWVAISLSLRSEEYFPGEYYVDYSDDFCCNIMPLNDEAAKAFEEDETWQKTIAAEEGEEYTCDWGGWTGWVVEGAHKGFMLQQTPDRAVILHKLEGCLGLDGDVEGIIWAAALGVVLLLGGDGSQIETPGWRTTQCRID